MRAAAVTFGSFLLAALTLAAPARAEPAPEPEFTAAQALACSGSACDGKDPAAYCGGDARTLDSLTLGAAILELRYSPSCRAAWARISNARWEPYSQFPGIARVTRDSDGRTYSCVVPAGGSSCYTLMVNDRNVTSFAYGEWDGGSRIYTGRTGSHLR
ncbi:DUF2690 domain-containing protein [Nonomuraea longicatena]|uniref:DUF2690 domain-containing protein n=1 Tax=Nonomuraea longicatena TaxID=83682 RepID=A0ABN1R3R4_9ACTN